MAATRLPRKEQGKGHLPTPVLQNVVHAVHADVHFQYCAPRCPLEGLTLRGQGHVPGVPMKQPGADVDLQGANHGAERRLRQIHLGRRTGEVPELDQSEESLQLSDGDIHLNNGSNYRNFKFHK